MRESKVTVKIPRPLYRKIQLVIESSGFSSPTDFIVFVLRDLVGEAEVKHAETPAAPEEYSPSDLEAVKHKLKNLGYL
jgi:Arc/MetJ-type ribon-helix-helix transcriptional regulator